MSSDSDRGVHVHTQVGPFPLVLGLLWVPFIRPLKIPDSLLAYHREGPPTNNNVPQSQLNDIHKRQAKYGRSN